MAETLIAAVSALIALAAGLVGYRAHRHQVSRAAVTDARQQRLDEREQTVSAREAAAERREALTQASMMDVTVRRVPSSLHEGWSTPWILVHNSSNQPVSDLNVRFRDQPVTGEPGVLFPGAIHRFLLPASEDSSSVPEAGRDVSIDFTDAAGIRWRREGDGGLREGHSIDDAWEWGAREEPVIMRFTGLLAPDSQLDPRQARDWVRGSGAPPPSLSHESCAGRAGVVLLVVALLVVVYLWIR